LGLYYVTELRNPRQNKSVSQHLKSTFKSVPRFLCLAVRARQPTQKY